MIIAVDTGGTKTIVARFSDDGILLQSTKIPTPKPVDEYVATISENIRLVAAGENITMISMALPGVIHDGIAEWCVNLGWKNVPIRQLMANNFPNVDILIDNDANLAGLASMCRLDYSPKCGLYITIGTGIGTALVLNGELHDALLDCEGGHMLLEFKGKNVEWEDIASGRVFNEMFGTISEDTNPEAWPEIAKRISVGLRLIVAFVQPDIVVIGGGVGVYADKFSDLLSGLLAESLPASTTPPRIVAAPHPEETVLYGCYDNAKINSQTD